MPTFFRLFARPGWCWLLVLAATLGASAAGYSGTPATLAGTWQGPLQLPSGQLEVVFQLVPLAGGEYAATLDVPQQTALHLAVTVATRADSIILAATEATSYYRAQLSADGTQLQGTWQQPGFATPLVLTRRTPAAARSRPAPPYHEEAVSFTNPTAQLQLAGTLTVPVGAGPFPAVVLVGEGGPAPVEVDRFAPLPALADYLTQHGVVVLCCDNRGTGRSAGSALATAAERLTDVRTALNYLRTRPEVNLDQLGVIGHGEGGNLALLAAAMPVPPAFVVCLAASGLPGADGVLGQQEGLLASLGVAPDQVAASGQRQRAMLEVVRSISDNAQAQAMLANMLRQSTKGLSESAAQLRAAELVSPYYRALLAFNPLEGLSKVSCPVLLLSGTADASTPAEVHASALAKSLKSCKQLTVKKLAGVNHLFQPDRTQWPLLNGRPRPVFSPEAEELLRSWIAARTTP